MIKKTLIFLLLSWGIFCLGWDWVIFVNYVCDLMKQYNITLEQGLIIFGILISTLLAAIACKDLKI